MGLRSAVATCFFSHVSRAFTLVSRFRVGDAEVQEKGLEVALSQSEHRWDPDTK